MTSLKDQFTNLVHCIDSKWNSVERLPADQASETLKRELLNFSDIFKIMLLT